MNTPHQIVDAVRWVMDGVIREKAQSQAIAEQFNELVQETRRRTAHCLSLVRRGARLEARDAAFTKPPLPEMLAAIHDPVLERWSAFCERHQLAVPAKVNAAEVEEFNESMQELDRMEPLLRQWRLENLRRDPAHTRIQTLWRLIRADPTNSAWRKDAQLFEEPALLELDGVFYRDLALGRLDQCWSITSFTSRKEWNSPIAAARTRQWQSQLRDIAPRNAQQRALEVARLLHSAYQERNVGRAAEQMKEYEALQFFLSDSDQVIPEPVQSDVAAVVDWLCAQQVEEDRRRDGAARLCALDALMAGSSAKKEELELALVAIERVPPDAPWHDLRDLTYQRIAAMKGQERRARTMRWTAAIAAILVVAACAAAGIMWIRGNEDARILATQAEEQIASGRLLDAAQVLDNAVSVGLDTREPIIAAMESLRVAQAARKEDERKFEVLFSDAGDPSSRLARPGAMDQAEGLSFSIEQRERIDGWRKANAAGEAVRLRERNDAFAARVKTISDEIARVAKDGPDAVGASAALASVQAAARTLSLEQGVSPATRATLDPVIARIRSMDSVWTTVRSERSRAADRNAAYATVGTAASNPARYAQALQSFSEEWPEDPRATNCGSAASDREAWSWMMDWTDRMTPLQGRMWPTASSARQDAIQAAEAHASKFQQSPFAVSASQYAKLLTTDSSWSDWLDTVMTRPAMRVGELKLLDGKSFFYVIGHPLSGETPTAKLFAVIRSGETLNKPETRSFDRNKIARDGVSPQSTLSRVVLQVIQDSKIDAPKRAATAFDLVAHTKEVDPLLRLAIATELAKLVEAQLPGSAKRFEEFLTTCSERRVPDVDFLAPSNEASNRARKTAADLLEGAPTAAQIFSDDVAMRKEVTRALSSTFKPVGRVIATQGIRSIELLPGVTRAAGTRLVAVTASVTSAATVIPLGADGSNLGAVPLETLVFEASEASFK
ncbi:MAG: hypothetical protein O2800_01450 [Planctomycetota bacterium]|nr:hypothetical protein [Planctomycetota bacterium]